MLKMIEMRGSIVIQLWFEGFERNQRRKEFVEHFETYFTSKLTYKKCNVILIRKQDIKHYLIKTNETSNVHIKVVANHLILKIIWMVINIFI